MTKIDSSRCFHTGTRPKAHVLWLLVCLGSVLACGPVEEDAGAPAPVTAPQELATDNGLSFNGLSFNGLSTAAFAQWFNTNAALADEVMRYTVRCAVPEGQYRTYRNATTGRTYSWAGELGLAPGWSSGASPTVAEQQLISACLAAHANKYGVVVPISVLGTNGQDQPISFSLQELADFPKQEGCFFGNLFTGQGLFVGSEGHLLGDTQSSSRACAIASTTSNGARTPCPPMVHVGDCSLVCTRASPLDPYYAQCTYGGVTYLPLTTRLRDNDIFNCGDGVCQVSESCGTTNRYDACRDCACP